MIPSYNLCAIFDMYMYMAIMIFDAYFETIVVQNKIWASVVLKLVPYVNKLFS